MDFIDSGGKCREAPAVLPLRSVRNFLTILSSRLWKLTTTRTTAGLQYPFRRRQSVGQLAEFVVDENPKRLKRSRRRVPPIDLTAMKNAQDDIGKLERARERRLVSPLDDRPCDGSRPMLLAERVDDVRDLFLFSRVDEIGGAHPEDDIRMSSGPSD